MTFLHWMPLIRCASVFAAAVLLAAGAASGQSASADNSSSSSGYSSSQFGLTQLAGLALPEAPAPRPSAAGSGQYGNGGGYGGSGTRGLFHNFTFEAGGGFNAPVGNDTPFISWGGNFTVGAGFRFSKRISALLEYQFMDDKLPGAFIAAEGVQAGDARINAITGSPVIDLFPKKSNGVYLVGGWGYYHKSTNFNDFVPEYGYFGYYDVSITVASITSNQWGGNAGLGIYHRLGNMYGGDTNSELFAEARYTFIHTPPISQTNGLGTTELIPVTLGIRF